MGRKEKKKLIVGKTLFSQSEQKDAFFGFDHVNSGNNGYGGPHGFADVGPNLAYPL